MYQYIVQVGNMPCPRHYARSDFLYKTAAIAKAAGGQYLDLKGIRWNDSMIHTRSKGDKDVQKTKRQRRAEKKKRKLLTKQSSRPNQRPKRSACRSKGAKYRKA